MGHGEDAKTVSIRKQQLLLMARANQERLQHRAAQGQTDSIIEQIRSSTQYALAIRIPRSVYSVLVGRFAGYGYRPARIGYTTLAVLLVSALIFHIAAEYGVMAPTDSRLYSNQALESCQPRYSGNWTKCDDLPSESTTFNALLYSLDLILPLVGLQQKRDWTPMVTRPCVDTILGVCIQPATREIEKAVKTRPGYWPLGVFAWVVMGLEILFGWIAGLLLAAMVSGVVKRD